jgi:hypothetical protein
MRGRRIRAVFPFGNVAMTGGRSTGDGKYLCKYQASSIQKKAKSKTKILQSIKT